MLISLTPALTAQEAERALGQLTALEIGIVISLTPNHATQERVLGRLTATAYRLPHSRPRSGTRPRPPNGDRDCDVVSLTPAVKRIRRIGDNDFQGILYSL
ncbi:unnamed protein product, partial [Iphiclides podalirius]